MDKLGSSERVKVVESVENWQQPAQHVDKLGDSFPHVWDNFIESVDSPLAMF